MSDQERIAQLESDIANLESTVSILADKINMSVKNGELLSQINIEAGQTLIKSGKLHLNAETVVFSDDTFEENKEEK